MVSVAYFDTSALVKCYIAELGSDWIRTLLENQGPNVFTSLITLIEAACTFARRQREGLLSSDDHHQLLTVFDYDFAYRYHILGVEPVVIDKARQMAKETARKFTHAPAPNHHRSWGTYAAAS